MVHAGPERPRSYAGLRGPRSYFVAARSSSLELAARRISSFFSCFAMRWSSLLGAGLEERVDDRVLQLDIL